VCVYVCEGSERWIQAAQRLIQTCVPENKVILCVCVYVYVERARWIEAEQRLIETCVEDQDDDLYLCLNAEHKV
jgi:hypothetical protein